MIFTLDYFIIYLSVYKWSTETVLAVGCVSFFGISILALSAVLAGFGHFRPKEYNFGHFWLKEDSFGHWFESTIIG